jgi:ferric-dicitrate binding protein FerR (iron transport regulator)
MDSNEKIWIAMSRSLSGELSSEEEKELIALLQNNPDLFQQYSMLKKLWNKNFSPKNILEEENNEKTLFKKILNKAEIERKNAVVPLVNSKSFYHILVSKPLLLAYAASLIITLVFFFNRSEPTDQIPQQIVSAPNGSRSKILLPDGTVVWLNGGSKLYYDYEFNGPVREVRLDGEAFFDVVKQKGKLFVVHTGNFDIKVHGTAFNVKYYQGDKNIEATLLHGKIEVADLITNKPSIFLAPNQKLIIPVSTTLETKKLREIKPYELINLDTKLAEKERIETAWIYNRIEFRGEKFEDLAKKLERWYNVEVKFADDSIKALTFNGSFEKETVGQAFNALQKVGTFNYTIQGREIFIKAAE